MKCIFTYDACARIFCPENSNGLGQMDWEISISLFSDKLQWFVKIQ
jgi:hypothetical protein